MPGETQTLEVSPGVEVEITQFTPDENKRFDVDYPKVTAVYTKNSVRGDGKHIISDWFDDTVETYRLLGQACKHDIQPSAGVFQGQRAMTGFGFRMIKPGDVAIATQLTFKSIQLPAGGALSWNGYLHNANINVAYNATPLYLRKELGIGWLGVRELEDPMFEEIQLELNGKPTPVYNMLQQMGRSTRPATAIAYGAALDTWNQGSTGEQDLKSFRFPSVEYMKPAIQYRSQVKAAAAGLTTVWGINHMTPLGLTFATSDIMRNIAQTRPTTAAP